MSDKEAVANFWQEHWNNSHIAAEDFVKGRYVEEAFAELNASIRPESSKILEAGCGTGRLCALLARARPTCEVVGLDISEASIGLARKLKSALALPNVHFEQGDLFSLSYPDDSFDTVFNEGVIHHFKEDGNPSSSDALREMIRVLKPGGQLIVTVANWNCYPHTLYKWILGKRGVKYPYGYEKSYRQAELARQLSEHGISDIQFGGYYPAHGFYRLASNSRLFHWLGRFTDLIGTPFVVNTFGFQMVARGIKPMSV